MRKFKLLSKGRGLVSLVAIILCAGTAIGQRTEKKDSTFNDTGSCFSIN